MFGVVKEINVDDEGLAEFQAYFDVPLYLDTNLQLYEYLGNRKLGLTTWNPWRLYKGFREMTKRLTEKNITGNLKGEGLIQGGVMVFNNNKVSVFEEETGVPFDTPAIQAALDGKVAPEL